MKRRDFLIRVTMAGLAGMAAGKAHGRPIQLGRHEPPEPGYDGEGTARIVSPTHVIAGQPTPITVEVTIGESGVPVGGGVMLGIHHAAQWRPQFHVDDPEAPAYVDVERASAGGLDATYQNWVPTELLEYPQSWQWRDGIFRQVIRAVVTDQPLEEGEVVRFRLGLDEARAATHAITDTNHQFRILTDTTGDAVYRGIVESPMLDIIAAKPNHLFASVPAQVNVGEPFTVRINVEDEYYNLVHDAKDRITYSSMATIRDEDGTILAEDVPIRNGQGEATIRVSTAGPRRLRIDDGLLEGRAIPCKAFEELPERRIYWGDIHGHTGISDGLGDDCDEYFGFGRDVAGLDVCALTDHGYFDWPQTKDAVQRYYEPGRYVTILGMEAGAGQDHVNYYYRRDDTDHVDGWYQDYEVLQQELFQQYNTGDEPEAAIGPHHFAYDRGDDRYPFGVWDPRISRFAEVYSSHGTSEFLDNPRPLRGPSPDERKYLQCGLEQGIRLSVIGASDCHASKPGRTIWGHYPGGLAAFLAPELTREAIWNAIWNRHTYATSMDRIYLEFTLDGHGMGEDIETGEEAAIRIEVIGQTDSLTVHLLRDNETILTHDTDTGHLVIKHAESVPSGEHFYYVRVEQDNGERAWSTPIWVRRA